MRNQLLEVDGKVVIRGTFNPRTKEWRLFLGGVSDQPVLFGNVGSREHQSLIARWFAQYAKGDLAITEKPKVYRWRVFGHGAASLEPLLVELVGQFRDSQGEREDWNFKGYDDAAFYGLLRSTPQQQLSW